MFGLIPAMQASQIDLSSTLKESAGRSGTGFRQNKMRAILVVSEVALALILLVGSALLIRTSLALSAVDPGFDAAHVLTMRMSLQSPKYFEADAVERLVRDGVERLRSVPGVELASATCCVPLEGGYGLGFVIQGRPLTDRPFHGGGGWLTVSPGYFEVFKMAVDTLLAYCRPRGEPAHVPPKPGAAADLLLGPDTSLEGVGRTIAAMAARAGGML